MKTSRKFIYYLEKFTSTNCALYLKLRSRTQSLHAILHLETSFNIILQIDEKSKKTHFMFRTNDNTNCVSFCTLQLIHLCL